MAHNSLPVYRIPAKVGTEMRLCTPFCAPNFKEIGYGVRIFIAVFVSVRKEEEKQEK